MARRYDAYSLHRINEHGFAQGVSMDGAKREFALVVHRDLASNALTLDVIRHFVDPESEPVWTDSEPWEKSETRGDTDG